LRCRAVDDDVARADVVPESTWASTAASEVAYKKPVGTNGCNWTTVPLSSFGASTATLDATIGPLSQARLAKFKKSERGHGRLIADLGNWAYWDETFPGGGALFVAKDGYMIQVEAFGVTTPLATDKTIALITLKHL
jgi:hypothetical protein